MTHHNNKRFTAFDCKEVTSSDRKQPKIFGDYELLIDQCLGGDSQLKRRVAYADKLNRGGLAIIINALKNQNILLTPAQEHILSICKQDQTYYLEKLNDYKNIRIVDGRYRVRVTVGLVRYDVSFIDLLEAQKWRDKMRILAKRLNDA